MATKKEIVVKTITVKQTGSPIRRDGRQVLYLKSLGLGRINKVRVLQDTPAVRGLVAKLSHMVTVVE